MLILWLLWNNGSVMKQGSRSVLAAVDGRITTNRLIPQLRIIFAKAPGFLSCSDFQASAKVSCTFFHSYMTRAE